MLPSFVTRRVGPLLALGALLWAAPALAQGTCTTGTQASGALYEVCTPNANANGTLVLYAHGFVFPQLPLTVPDDIPSELFTAQGFAYASTSYYANGLVLPELAIDDLTELIDIYTAANGAPDQVLLVGFSNGALISTIALERYPDTFNGALASCGPLGSYARNLDYLGDVFNVFDFYFPTALDDMFGVEAGGPAGVNPAYFDALVAASGAAGVSPRDFLAGYLAGVLGDPANAALTAQVFGTIAATPEIAATIEGSVEGATAVITAASFVVFAVNDAIDVLGGESYDNTTRLYINPFGDTGALNAGIARYAADPAARAALEAEFETTGQLQDPLIALHTTRDVLVPIWQEAIYGEKASPSILFDPRPIERFGHCAFTNEEIAGGFADLVLETQTACGFSFLARAKSSLEVPSAGGRAQYVFGVDNSGNPDAATVDIWATVQNSSGDLIYVRNPRTFTVGAGETLAARYNQRIPGYLPDGEYTYTIFAGSFDAANPAASIPCGAATFDLTKGDDDAPVAAHLLASDWADVEIVAEAPAAAALVAEDAVRLAPNPTRGQTTFSFGLDADAEVSLAVYDVRGREVAQVVDGPMTAGPQEVTFARELPAGVYVWRLAAGDVVHTGRLTVVR